MLAKPTGAICNLDCDYCFLAKEELYPGSSFRMGEPVLEAYISQLLASHRTPEVTIAWQGEEPTMMGLEFYRHVLDLVDAHRRPGQVIEHTIQTNATRIDDGWASFLAEHDLLVGVSIDGPAHLHDAHRRDKGDKPTFDRVVRGLRVLQAHGVRWSAPTTVNATHEAHPLQCFRTGQARRPPRLEISSSIEGHGDVAQQVVGFDEVVAGGEVPGVPATAAARRTGSSPPRTASPACTT